MPAVKPQSSPDTEHFASAPAESTLAESSENNDSPVWCVGPYEIRDKIGQGGMATVYRAWHTNLHRFEALKIPRHATGADSEYIPRLLAEARMAARLFHPHIVAIHNISEDGAAHPYFSMDLVEGQDLSQLLKERGPLPLNESIEIVRQTASGITHAHQQGVVHRDIKPENILLQPTGDGQWLVKVVDFGISRAAEDMEGTRLTRSGMMVGTPEYMSPEQSGSGDAVDFRTDIYSLGIVAYEMLTGAPPFSVGEDVSRMAILISHARDLPRSPREANSEIPEKVSDVIMRALVKKPDERFASADEFASALEAARPVQEKVLIAPGRTALNIHKSKRGWAAMAGAVTIGVLIGWLASTITGRSIVATAADLPANREPQSTTITNASAPVIRKPDVRKPDVRKQVLQRAIAFEKTTRQSTSLLKGQRKIAQNGANGLREIVLQISSRDGKELSRNQISTRVLRAAIPQVELIGTRAPVAKVVRKAPIRRARTRSVLRASSPTPIRKIAVSKRRIASPKYSPRSTPRRVVLRKSAPRIVKIGKKKTQIKKSNRPKKMKVSKGQVLGSFRLPSSRNR